MAKRNGGIIGPDNVPAGPLGAAGGVWRLEDAFNYQKAGLWPTVLGYQIPNSLRFNSGSSDYLNRTPSVAGNRQIWTWSGWIKRGKLSVNTRQLLLSAGNNDGTDSGVITIGFTDADVFAIETYQTKILTTQVFRDISAWYHIVVAVDTTQTGITNQAKLYVNGSQVTQFSSTNAFSASVNTPFNNTIVHEIGRQTNATSRFFDGYQSEVYWIDGQQLTPSSFGETDSTTGIWIPKPYSGTYGTNGFYLKFQDSSALGDDTSGNGNDWTVNNLTSIDQSYDSPTNNFATLNPLNTYPSTKPVLSEGNLQVVTVNADPGYWGASSTLGMSSGKWYVEFKPTNSTSGSPYLLGVSYNPAEMARNGATGASQYTSADWGYYGGSGDIYNNGGNTAYGNTYTTNDIIGVALDLDNNKLYFSKNGTFQNSGVPTSGATGTGAISITANQTYFFFISDLGGGVCTYQANFGYPPFTISSGNADANGFGNFEYAVPSGYYALCSKNLALYG